MNSVSFSGIAKAVTEKTHLENCTGKAISYKKLCEKQRTNESRASGSKEKRVKRVGLEV